MLRRSFTPRIASSSSTLLRATAPLFNKKTAFEEQYGSLGSNIAGAKPQERTSLSVVMDRKGSGKLLDVLNMFKNEDISLEYISSRECPLNASYDKITMYFDWGLQQSNPKSQAIIKKLKETQFHVQVLGSWNTPYFASTEYELDKLEQKTLAGGAELQDDPANPHPGFHDEKYKERRREITMKSSSYRFGAPVPYLEYLPEENATWTAVWDKLVDLYPTHAYSGFNNAFQLLIERGGYSRDKIPQLADVNRFLMPQTGFYVRPVTGLLSARDFFNGLALRTFFSTQYIRHHSKPLYTPEPDVVHELMGHVPLFADPDFADFSQLIGIASLGATDEVVEQLARCYWYSVEFGLLRENGKLKAYGAGLLSSFGELQYSLESEEPKRVPWDPFEAAKLEFPITKYQPLYFVADGFGSAKAKLRDFADGIDSAYKVRYNKTSRSLLAYPKHVA